MGLVCLQISKNKIHLTFWSELSKHVGAQDFPVAL